MGYWDYISGGEEGKTKRIVVTVIIVVIVVLILAGVIYLIYKIFTNLLYTDSSFVGMTGNYMDYNDLDKDALVVLYKENKDLLEKTRVAERMDIDRVRYVYHKFLKNCDKSRCPLTVYNAAKVMLDYIKYSVDFSSLEGNSWKQVRVGLNEMDKLLVDLFHCIMKVSNTVSGSSDPHLSKLSEQYKDVHREKKHYINQIKNNGEFEDLEVEQIVDDLNAGMKYRSYSKQKDNTYLESLTPMNEGALSAHEYLVAEGREKPFNGNVREWSRAQNKVVLNEPLVDDTQRNVDVRYAKPGLVGTIRNTDSITNYRGRDNYTFDNVRECCDNKC